MRIQKCYPGGRRKTFNISYDDGVLQDVRFAELLNRYGLKGTFNLNSGLMRSGFVWTHECGMEIRRLSEAEAKALYEGHEVASHTLTHPYLNEMDYPQVLREMTEDKRNLEDLFGREVGGFAVPFTYYSPMIAHCAREAGFEYARISEEGGTFCPPRDPYWWRAGVLHWSQWMMDFVYEFLYTDEELALCQIAGHSYDLDVMDLWDTMEDICQKVSASADVWPATHLEIVRYLRAMEQAEITEKEIVNPSDTELWFLVDGRAVSVTGHGIFSIESL